MSTYRAQRHLRRTLTIARRLETARLPVEVLTLASELRVSKRTVTRALDALEGVGAQIPRSFADNTGRVVVGPLRWTA